MCAKFTICFILLVAIVMAQEYKSGEMLVFFKNGVVVLASGEQRGRIEAVQGSEGLRNYLNALGFQEIRRAIPDFSPADTIALLDDGTIAKIPNYSRLFKGQNGDGG